MASKKRKSAAVLQAADGVGGLRAIEDHRFSDNPWQLSTVVPAAEADLFMAHLEAETRTRGWTASSLGQLNAEDNSGSMTVYVGAGQPTSAIEIAWDKPRRRPLHLRARPGGDPPAPNLLVEEFFATVAARHKERRLDRAHRRFWFVYEGLQWSGELWLGDSVRLGPPSKHPESLLGRQALIVDAMVEGIGFAGVTATFQRIYRELRLALSPIIGVHLETPPQWKSDWVPEIDDKGHITDCRLRSVGYTEIGLPPGLPARGAEPAAVRETVTRPGLGRYGIWPDDHTQRVPDDIEALWDQFQVLSPALKEQFLHACNAYSIAQSLWPEQRTAYAAFLVISCEALKPKGARYDRANVYDVVASFTDDLTATSLRKLRIPPQSVRSKHVHRGVLVADEVPSLLLADPFGDPSFDETVTVLSQVTRICLIDWLRRGGQYNLVWLPHSNSRSKRRNSSARARPNAPTKRS